LCRGQNWVRTDAEGFFLGFAVAAGNRLQSCLGRADAGRQRIENSEGFSSARVGNGFVVAYVSPSEDGSNFSPRVFVRRYDADGLLLGPPRLVHEVADVFITGLAVTALKKGGFVVTFYVDRGAQRGVHARLFDSTGTPQSSTFRLNEKLAIGGVDVKGLTGGGFVAAWLSRPASTLGDQVVARRFTAAGQPEAHEIIIGSHDTDAEPSVPSLAPLDGDGFVIVWSAKKPSQTVRNVYGRLAPGAGPRSNIFIVNTRTGFNSDPSVATLSNGEFVVAFDGYYSSIADQGIFARRYGPDGAPGAPQFQVNATAASRTAAPGLPVISRAGQDGFVVAWTVFQPSDGSDIHARRFDSADQPDGGDFELGYADPLSPSVAPLPDGEFVIVWTQQGARGGIFGQRFR
jgi:large repetitive protein